MSSLLTLLLFCDFLENRLHTSNLLLLRRMLSDFFAGNEHTLQDFIRLGASLVAVMPMERTRRCYREEAARLLTQQRQMKEKPQPQLCVFRYLSARVATKNIFWLRDMFQEFCSGHDALLRAFVSRGNEVVSVIPVDIQALQYNSMATQWQTGPSLQWRLEHEQQRESCSDSEEEDDDEITTLAELASVASIPPPMNDLCTCIMEVLDRVEEQEPWNRVFDPDTLPLPFSGVTRSKSAAALKKFWAKHARAVWERPFWAPLVSMSDRRRHSARKRRQAEARRDFETVMMSVHEEFGAEFFVQLDQRTKPHKGWWYVEPVQDLLLIAQHVGLAACLNYIESQALQRFPISPGSEVRTGNPNNGKSKSMWSISSAMGSILREICALKDRNSGSKRKTKKRALE
ncbi:hypothetical protein PR003_g25115 [Phytophthora rubi]|uniref:Uncharacterized protein n=1 Tax=Phytophthora rubi TaxID=129364 RepID=A0A6A4CKX4_9STRA|nr:hypothetical protein PR001_g23680 [Phytophthora rubi]KAE9291140.1 hypothetical protein PR003_g25115 [Phytophthora rubi]